MTLKDLIAEGRSALEILNKGISLDEVFSGKNCAVDMRVYDFMCNNLAQLLDAVERLESALEKIYEAETINFKEITWNPKKWETVHDVVRETAHEALNPKRKEGK